MSTRDDSDERISSEVGGEKGCFAVRFELTVRMSGNGRDDGGGLMRPWNGVVIGLALVAGMLSAAAVPAGAAAGAPGSAGSAGSAGSQETDVTGVVSGAGVADGV